MTCKGSRVADTSLNKDRTGGHKLPAIKTYKEQTTVDIYFKMELLVLQFQLLTLEVEKKLLHCQCIFNQKPEGEKR